MRKQVLIWLGWESVQSKSQLEKDDYKLQLIDDGMELIFPEPLADYRRFKQYGIPTFSGGLYNQPHIQLMEFDAVQAAISENEFIQYSKNKQNSSALG